MNIQITDTPCPTKLPWSSNSTTLSTILDQETTNLDYTRLVRQEFIAAKPRRPRRIRNAVDVAIFEDENEGQELVREKKQGAAWTDTKTLLRGPATRIPHAAIISSKDRVGTGSTALQQENGYSSRTQHGCGDRSKEHRRRTIFVPSDGTTVMTIHPRSSLASRADDTVHVAWRQGLTESGSGRAYDSTYKAPSTTLRSAPRRVPLSAVKGTENVSTSIIDVHGATTGKENVAPGEAIEGLSKGQTKVTTTSRRAENIMLHEFQPKPAHLGTKKESTASSILKCRAEPATQRPSGIVTSYSSIFSPLRHSITSPKEKSPDVTRLVDNEFQSSSLGSKSIASGQIRTSKQCSSIHTAVRQESIAASRVDQYKPIAQDIRTPALYEDHWLDLEEAALAQLLNHVLAQTEPRRPDPISESTALQKQLLDIYHSLETTSMFARLKSAIRFGSLKIPESALQSSDLTKDLRLRREYISLYLGIYNPKLLAVAAEVVVGRSIQTAVDTLTSPSGLLAAEKVLDTHKSKRALTAFLETFFVRVDDHFAATSTDHEIQRQQHDKRLLRSLMLIWVLDQAKHSCTTTPLLFRKESSHKSSRSVLQALVALLMPSLGDVNRALQHSGYVLFYTQLHVDELTFQVRNLATDIRDGTILARLVDVLVPGPSNSRSCLRQLTLPCHARIQKIANVGIVLSALSMDYLPTAADIVDGHREKTVNLLWLMMTDFALEKLIDWKDLAKDVAAVKHMYTQAPTHGTQQVEESTYSDRLLQWATVHCQLKRHPVTNLTTSFADGRAYLELIRSYTDRMLPAQLHSHKDEDTLQDCMRIIGCNDALIRHFTSSHVVAIPSQVTTLANLALLAATLLPLQQRWDAAIFVQRAFRRKRLV